MLYEARREDYQPTKDTMGAKNTARTLTRAYPYDTSKEIEQLVRKFKQSGEAQEVSFRDLVYWIKVGERASHYLHPYPAKLLPQIAHFFLSSNFLASADDVVLDPFAGSGTVALEANLSGRRAFYCDANPLARLIASTKTAQYPTTDYSSIEKDLFAKFARSRSTTCPDVVNIDKWYEKPIQRKLSRLRSAIGTYPDGITKDLLWVTFSSVTRKVSNADPRLSVPVKLKRDSTIDENKKDVWKTFSAQWKSNVARIRDLEQLRSTSRVESVCVGEDARNLRKPQKQVCATNRSLPKNSVGLIITSPPYAGAQKYIRASSLSLGWLDLAQPNQLKALENENIGREHHPKSIYTKPQTTGIYSADDLLEQIFKVNPLRAAIAGIYINEMRSAIKEMARVLKPGGHIVLIIGDNDVCGLHFKSSEYLATLLEENGLKPIVKLVDTIKSRGLMTKRNKTASVISREWVLVYSKN